MFHLVNLDEHTRQLMREEIDWDVRHGTFHVSPRLSNTGQHNYLTLLTEAAREHDPDWLAGQLRRLGRLRTSEPRRKPTGGYTIARTPRTSAATLAEGEFNRYYARALARRAIADGVPSLVVYRAKPVARPRAGSEWMVGTTVDPRELLDDLRTHPGEETVLGIPGGPNSGLSVRLP
jgi:hypothetical protein